MKIHCDPRSVNSRKVLAGLELMGAPYELVNVDYFKAEHQTDAYKALNPNAAMPTLVDGDFVLWESNAILQYAADKIGAGAAYPADLKTRADINRWLFWEDSSWFPACYVYLVENCVKPLLGGATDAAVLEAHQPQFDKLASILDKRLEGRDWVAGRGPTIADIALAAPMHLHVWQRLPLNPYQNIRRWMCDHVERLPGWQKTWVGEGFVTQRQ